MRLTLSDTYKNLSKILQPDCTDLSNVKFVEPWGIAVICALIIERANNGLYNVKLPKDSDLQTYLKRIHFDQFLSNLSCISIENSIDGMHISESDTLNLQEIELCASRDVFNARLERFHKMFSNFGLTGDEASRATSLV